MGIWNDISGALSKGMEGAGRFADATSLKFKLGEVERRRRDLAADLGERLYDSVESGSELPAECERIIADMRACDVEIARTKTEMERIARETEEAKAASASSCCPHCGAALSPSARFCHACGAPMAASPQNRGPQQPACDGQGAQTCVNQAPEQVYEVVQGPVSGADAGR